MLNEWKILSKLFLSKSPVKANWEWVAAEEGGVREEGKGKSISSPK